MNLLRSFPSSLTYLKQKKAGQKNHFPKKQTIVCFFYFFSDSAQITGDGISVKILLPETDLGSRNDADPTGSRHCSRQTGQADPHTHASLDHGNICM